VRISKELYEAAQTAVRDCLAVQPRERVLVVTDEPCRQIGYALREAARDVGGEVLLIEMTPRSSNGEEPPNEVAVLMGMVDVVLCPTSKSLTHTDARRAATERGARIATLPGITEEVMVRCMSADYNRIAQRTDRLCRLLEEAETVRVTTPRGTDIRMPIGGRTPLASSGLLKERGQWCNLPTGEAYVAPVEGGSEGIVVVDGSMAGIGLIRTPIHITVEAGYATTIEGGDEARQLLALFEPHGHEARNLAEFGIGTNDRAILTGVILEDEKVMGTVHIAFGDNMSMGGSVRVASHLDGLLRSPTVWLDDRVLVAAGAFRLPDF
jgi:leucyl aminopeptidase (aminopeptidase T)